MKKAAASLAVLATILFLAASATSALAEIPQWNINGEPVASAVGAQGKATIVLSDLKASILGDSSVECKMSLDGNVSAFGGGEITEILNTSGEKISSTQLTGVALLCPGVTGCEGNAEVWPVGLPWDTQLQPIEAHIQDRVSNESENLGFEVVCSVFGIKESDECTQSSMDLALANESTGVLSTVSEENIASCSLSAEKTGDMHGEGLITSTGGGTLSVKGNDTIALVGNGSFGAVPLNKPSTGKVFTLVTTEERLLIENVQIVKPTGSGEFRFGAIKVCKLNLVLEVKGLGKNTCNTEVVFEPLGDPMSTAELEITFEETVSKNLSSRKSALTGTGM